MASKTRADARNHYYDGKRFRGMKKYIAAIEAFEEATRIDPDYSEVWYYRAELHLQLQEFTLAAEAANRTIELNPSWSSKMTAIFSKAKSKATKTAEEERAAREALRLLEEGGDETPSVQTKKVVDIDALIKEAMSLTQEGQLEQALKIWHRTIREPRGWKWYFCLSVALDKYLYTDDRTTMDRAEKFCPTDGLVWFYVWKLINENGNRGIASHAFEKAKKFGYFQELIEIGRVLRKSRQFYRSIWTFDRVLEVDSRSAEAYLEKGLCKTAMGLKQGAGDLERAGQLDSTILENYADDIDTAHKYYEENRRVRPKPRKSESETKPLEIEVVLHGKEKKLKDLSELEEIAERKKTDSTAWVVFCREAYEQGEFEQADYAANQALALDPDLVIPMKILGEIYWIWEDYPNCRHIYKRLVKHPKITRPNKLEYEKKLKIAKERTKSLTDEGPLFG